MLLPWLRYAWMCTLGSYWKELFVKNRRIPALLAALTAVIAVSGSAAGLQAAAPQTANEVVAGTGIKHVLLISIDGFHAVDLMRYMRFYPNSTLAQLAGTGVMYPNAQASLPSDSFPGILAMTTGGTPRSTGVWYDNSYDHALLPPGSACPSTAKLGTQVLFDEALDKNLDALDGGGNSSVGSIDVAKLPIDPATCKPVYPHNYLRVNTIFEVARAAGSYTAWADKHPSYDLLNGPSGQGVADLYTPEIAAGGTTGSITKTEAYDDLKVQAIVNEIDGKRHDGSTAAPVPAIFGMNFQAVSVGEKLKGNGYLDSQAQPSAGLADALAHTDQSLGKMVAELRARGLFQSTLIIVTAKHGQSPIDPSKRKIVAEDTIPNIISDTVAGGANLVAQFNGDDFGMLWLTDHNQTDAVVGTLQTPANEAAAGIQEILAGDSLNLRFGNSTAPSRTPDVVVLPNYGVIYAGAKASKLAEHGGFNSTSMNVALLISNPALAHAVVAAPVQTTQIAPTILSELGLNPNALQAVRLEYTPLLPGINTHLGR